MQQSEHQSLNIRIRTLEFEHIRRRTSEFEIQMHFPADPFDGLEKLTRTFERQFGEFAHVFSGDILGRTQSTLHLHIPLHCMTYTRFRASGLRSQKMISGFSSP